MIIILTGASHTGKTVLAQRLLEKYQYPYLSIDHLKMGLIRIGQTSLTPSDDDMLTPYLWGIVKEIIKTAIENQQNLIIEGVYVPFDWQLSFSQKYLEHIHYCCLIMTKEYIRENFQEIKKFANAIEQRIDDSDLSEGSMIDENVKNFEMCKKYHCHYLLIKDKYEVELSKVLG